MKVSSKMLSYSNETCHLPLSSRFDQNLLQNLLQPNEFEVVTTVNVYNQGVSANQNFLINTIFEQFIFPLDGILAL